MRLPSFAIAFILLMSCLAHSQSGDFEIAEVNAKAGTFTGKVNGQLRSFRVRPDVDVTINGLKATFEELEPGMKVKVTSADPGIATRLMASGLRTRQPAAESKLGLGGNSQTARQIKATIPANSPDAFAIGDVRKGTKISLQYVNGKWKSWGRIATSSPDDEKSEGWELCRVAIALPSQDGKGGEVVALVPADTKKRPFIFEAETDYPGLVLRINDKENSFSGNPGSVEYSVKILPPIR